MLKGFERKETRLIECNAPIVGISVKDILRDHCVYEVWRGETLLYLGCCHLHQVWKMPDFKINAWFIKNVDVDEPLSIAVKWVGDRIDCYNKRGQMLRAVMPDGNRYIMIQSKMLIMCNEDGKKYRTQAEVCEIYGIRQSNLSSHLAGKPGFTTCGGRTFARVMEDENNI